METSLFNEWEVTYSEETPTANKKACTQKVSNGFLFSHLKKKKQKTLKNGNEEYSKSCISFFFFYFRFLPLPIFSFYRFSELWSRFLCPRFSDSEVSYWESPRLGIKQCVRSSRVHMLGELSSRMVAFRFSSGGVSTVSSLFPSVWETVSSFIPAWIVTHCPFSLLSSFALYARLSRKYVL